MTGVSFFLLSCGASKVENTKNPDKENEAALSTYLFDQDETVQEAQSSEKNLSFVEKVLVKFDRNSDRLLDEAELGFFLQHLAQIKGDHDRKKQAGYRKELSEKSAKICLDADNDGVVTEEEKRAAKEGESLQKYKSCILKFKKDFQDYKNNKKGAEGAEQKRACENGKEVEKEGTTYLCKAGDWYPI